MCKTVQATPQAGHSRVLEVSSSSQGASGLNGAARREMEVNGSAAGKKVADSNELERLFTQPNIQDTHMVSHDSEKLFAFKAFHHVCHTVQHKCQTIQYGYYNICFKIALMLLYCYLIKFFSKLQKSVVQADIYINNSNTNCLLKMLN